MSIWTIEETSKALCFVENHPNYLYQVWDIIQCMTADRHNSPVQIPVIGCWNGYENCLLWHKE